MLRTFQKRHPPVGARPGTLVIPKVAPKPRIAVVEYDVDHATTEAIRRGVWPQQEALTRVLRGDAKPVPDDVRLYPRDTHDHCTQLVDVIDSQRELVTSLMNTYLSLVANKTNDVMRMLTVVSSIFIPLTFVVGWYGMNFSRMPETHAAWGYPIVIGVSVGITLGMVLWFRHRGWLGGGARDPERDRDRERDG